MSPAIQHILLEAMHSREPVLVTLRNGLGAVTCAEDVLTGSEDYEIAGGNLSEAQVKLYET